MEYIVCRSLENNLHLMIDDKESQKSFKGPQLQRSRSWHALSSDRLPLISTMLVTVGSNKAMFIMDEAAVSTQSNFFRMAMRSGCMESKNHYVHLPEVEVELFELFAQWLSSGMIANELDDEPAMLARAYMMGESLQADNFMNAIIDRIATIDNVFLNSLIVPAQLYGQTLPDSPLRLLYVDLWVANGTGNEVDNLIAMPDENDMDFMVDFMLAVLNKDRRVSPRPPPYSWVDPSYCARYHRHKEPRMFSCQF